MEVDLEATGTRAHKALLQNARARNSHLLQQPASPDAKIDFIQFKILPIILATAKLANWTMTAYQELNKPFTQAYKRILAFPLKIPTTLFYLLTRLGGMGLPRLSDRSKTQKWQTLERCSAVGKDAAASIFLYFIHTLKGTSRIGLQIGFLINY
jgi:hypothetical protein